MNISIFTDELYVDVDKALPVIKGWGVTHVDFRGMINGKGIEFQTEEELRDLKEKLDRYGLKVGALQTSLAKVHLPDKERQEEEREKLEGIIRASEILGTKLVRCFCYWQQEPEDKYFAALAMMPDMMNQVLERFQPLASRAKEAGLILGFENCGQTPDEVISILKALDVPGWGMAWDPANYFDVLPEAKGDCISYFAKALQYTNMIHAKSWGVIDELGFKHVPWDRILAGASTLGKDFPVSIETHNPPFSPYTNKEATHIVYNYIKKMMPASAPSDMQSALKIMDEFPRPYSADPVRFVVVGLGMGKNRAKQITETDGTCLYGVCDINVEKAKEIGELYKVPYSDDIETFLQDPEVEVMYIVTPTGMHCSIAEKCLEAGKHVLVTKPIDANVDNCSRAIQLAKEKGLLFGIDFDFHFDTELSDLKAALEKGFFGQVLSVNTILNILRTDEYYKENGEWRGTWKLDGGGAFSNQGIHEINRILTLFGRPDKVRAMIDTKIHDIEAEDFGISEWIYEGGPTVRFSSTTCYPASTWSARIEIIGTKGVYYYTTGGPEGNHIYWWSDGKWKEEAPYPTSRQWRQASDNFAYCVRTGQALELDAEVGRESRYILDKMYESAKSGEGWVKL